MKKLLLFVFCLISVGTYAQTQITTADQFQNINNNLGDDYILMNDIDLSSIYFTPIGSGYGGYFTGTFDGNGHTITISNVNASSSNRGVFGQVGPDGTVKNLVVKGTIQNDLDEISYVGGIAGKNYGTITNCCSFVNINVSGYDYNSPKSVEAGGIAGYNYGTITYCFATSTEIMGPKNNSGTGGIVGLNDHNATIQNCVFVGNISDGWDTKSKYYGLICGNKYNTYDNVTNNYYLSGGNYTGLGGMTATADDGHCTALTLDDIRALARTGGVYASTTNEVFKNAILTLPWTSGDCTVTLADGVLTISGTGAMADYSSNSEIPWYSSRNSITSIVVGSGVTHIGNNSFRQHTKVTSVTLNEGLLTIGDYAFYQCNNTGFTSITIPASVTSIGNNAFQSCSRLATVTFSDGSHLTSIGNNAFRNTTTVTLKSNPSIGTNAFRSGATVTMNLTAHEGETGEYWTTFYNENYDFLADANTEVFKVALSGTTLTMNKVANGIADKNTAVVLKTTGGNPVMTWTTYSSNDEQSNSLTGVSAVDGVETDGTFYVLNYTVANGAGFYKLAFTKKVGLGKAYLTYSAPATAPSFFGFGGNGEGTTGVNEVKGKTEDVRGEYYDLQGRRVAQPTKGLYIVNGKKVIIK